MMEIKFRGKRKDGLDNRWYYGYISKEPNGTYWMDFYPKGARKTIEVIPETVAQFIGLKDEYGEDIYVGDLIEGKTYDNMPINGVVKFEDGSFFIQGETIRWYRWYDYTVKKVGDIFNDLEKEVKQRSTKPEELRNSVLQDDVSSKTEEIHKLTAKAGYPTRIHIQIGFGLNRCFVYKDFDLPFAPDPYTVIDLNGTRIPDLSMDFVDCKYHVRSAIFNIHYSYNVRMDHCPVVLMETLNQYKGWIHYGDSFEAITDALI